MQRPDERAIFEKFRHTGWLPFKVWIKWREGKGATRVHVTIPGASPFGAGVGTIRTRVEVPKAEAGPSGFTGDLPVTPSPAKRGRSGASSTPQTQDSKGSRGIKRSRGDVEVDEEESFMKLVSIFQSSQVTVGERVARLLSTDTVLWQLTDDQEFELTNALMENQGKSQVYLGLNPDARKRWAFRSLGVDMPPPPPLRAHRSVSLESSEGQHSPE